MTMELIKLPDVMKMTGLSRSTIYLYMARDEFPKPVRIGLRAVAWRKEQVELWIKQKIVASAAQS